MASGGAKYGNMQISNVKLRSSIKAGARVLGTKWELPELRSVLGEAWG